MPETASVAVPIPLGFLDGSLGPEDDEAGGEAELAQNLTPTSRTQPGPSNANSATGGVQAKCSRLPTEPAIAAAAAGDVDKLRQALRDGWPADKTCAGATALHWAAGCGWKRCCEVLLREGGAKIDYSGRSGRTALHWAARNGRTELCAWLVGRGGIGQQLSHLCYRRSHWEGCSTFSEMTGGKCCHRCWHGAPLPLLPKPCGEPLQRLRNGKRLPGANPKKVTHDGVSLFHWAVFGRCIDTASWAISAGSDPQGRNRWGCSAIHWAASTGDLKLCAWLMDEVGLDFGLRNNQGHDGLMKAAWNGARELCELLLQRDPKAILGRDRAGLGPPEMARINGHRDLADWLQEYAQDASGETGKKAEARSLPSLTSPAFVVFYRNQALVPPGEWDRLHAALLSPLPVTLRLRPCCHREGLARMLGKASRSGPVRLLPSAVAPISFFQVGSSDWKKDTALQEACDHAVRAGLADSNLDAEDLLAVELLGLEPRHSVLDMCAGNCCRALACLDAMAAKATSRLDETLGSSAFPDPQKLTGIVVANGENAKHFVEASSFLRRGSVPMLATVGNPVRFPCLFSEAGEQELYDRVVCAPQSTDDGLLRSKAHMWHEWRMAAALLHHTRQLKLLLRGLHLLAPGGRLLYCTRSLNPLEGEAVVMAAMRRYKGAVKLLDLQGSLPEWAVPSEAMMGWRVPDPEGVSLFRFYSNWTDVPSALKPPAGPLRETMFPDEELAPQLSRCVRFLPSPEERQGRTAGYGGSFFALFGKVFHRAAHAGDWDATKPSGNGGSGKRPKFARIYRELEKDELETLEEFYGLSLDRMLPTPAVLAADCSANGSSPRTLCALSRAVANAAIRNAAGLTASQMHCVGAGMPIFHRLDQRFLKGVACRWRPAAEASLWLAQHATRRVLQLGAQLLLHLLEQRVVQLSAGEIDPSSPAGRICGVVFDEPSCCCPDRGYADPGGVLVGNTGSNTWVPALLSHTELRLAADKDLSAVLISLLKLHNT